MKIDGCISILLEQVSPEVPNQQGPWPDYIPQFVARAIPSLATDQPRALKPAPCVAAVIGA